MQKTREVRHPHYLKKTKKQNMNKRLLYKRERETKQKAER